MNRFAALLVTLVGATSTAHANVEIGGTAGLHTFSNTSGLGVPEEPGANSLKNSALFGLRVGAYFGEALGVEAEGGLIPTEPRELVFDVYGLAYRANVVYQVHSTALPAKLVPFALAGAGALQIVDSADETEIEKETNIAFHAGFGAKYLAANDFGVRFDVRALLVPSSEGGQTLDFEALFSVYKEFGRSAAPKAPEQVAPPVEADTDNDGVVGAADQCAAEAEDKDGFQDEDGCPDPDNDGDGVPDASDKCAAEGEDKDNFQDDDGCPDPDNDGDGVPDAADKCSDQPETQNGFEDDDGCADEVPAKLSTAMGVLSGVTFKANTADLTAASKKPLDNLAAVLKEFPGVRVEIQGHSDDQAPKNAQLFADSTALSQAQADAVKTYLVSQGVEETRVVAKGYGNTVPAVDQTGLTGGKLNAARAKNRRIEAKLVSAAVPATP